MQTTSPLYQKIIDLLDKNHIMYTLYEHEPVFTSKQAAEVRQTKNTAGAKALLFIADTKPVLIVLRGTDKVNTKRFKEQRNIKDLRFASKEEVYAITGVEIGAVPPMGTIINIPTFVDKQLLSETEIAFNAGAHTKSIKMKTSDYIAVIKPTVVEIAEENT